MNGKERTQIYRYAYSRLWPGLQSFTENLHKNEKVTWTEGSLSSCLELVPVSVYLEFLSLFWLLRGLLVFGGLFHDGLETEMFLVVCFFVQHQEFQLSLQKEQVHCCQSFQYRSIHIISKCQAKRQVHSCQSFQYRSIHIISKCQAKRQVHCCQSFQYRSIHIISKGQALSIFLIACFFLSLLCH